MIRLVYHWFRSEPLRTSLSGIWTAEYAEDADDNAGC